MVEGNIEREGVPAFVQGATDRRDAILSAVRYATDHLLGSTPLESDFTEVLQHIGESAEVGSATVLELVDEPSRGAVLVPRYSWTIAGAQSVFEYAPQGFSHQEADFEHLIVQLGNGNPIIAHTRELPQGLQALLPEEVRSIIALPIFARGDFVGTIAFSQRWSERNWSLSEINALGAAANLFGFAMPRERPNLELSAHNPPFRSMVEGNPDIFALLDCDGVFHYLSPSVIRLLGYTPDELIDTSAVTLVHPEDREGCCSLLQHAARQPDVIQIYEHRFQHKKGHWLCFESYCRGLMDTSGIFGILISSRDISDRREAEERRIELIEQRQSTLMREIHHRIKNNLQGVVGLLRQDVLTHPELKTLVDVAITRINAASLSLKLYGAGKTGPISLGDMLAEIGKDKALTFPEVVLEIPPAIKQTGMMVAKEEVMPVAVIINELVVNAIKACLSDRCKKPTISVLLMEADDSIRIRIASACGSLPEGFDFNVGRKLGTGLQIVKALMPLEGMKLNFSTTGRRGVAVDLLLSHPVLVNAVTI